MGGVQGRNYLRSIRLVHLPPEELVPFDMALQAGRLRDNWPVLLRIRAAEAHTAGVAFGTPAGDEDDIYLAGQIPPTFFDFTEDVATS